MFIKTKIIAQARQIRSNFFKEKLSDIKEIYTSEYARIVKDYEDVLQSKDQEKFSKTIQDHNHLVIDTAKSVLATYEIPEDFPWFGFFSGSFGYEANVLGSDYDINFIYEDCYYKWVYPLEKKFLKDFAFVTDTKLTSKNFHNVTINIAYTRMLKQNNWKSLLEKPLALNNSLLKIKSEIFRPTVLTKMFILARETNNIYIKKALKILINTFLDVFIDNKFASRNSEMVNEYISEFIHEPWVAGIKPLIGDKSLYYFNEENPNKHLIVKFLKDIRTTKHHRKICDKQSFTYEVKHRSFNLSLKLLNMIRILYELDTPVTLSSLTNNSDMESIIGIEKYTHLSNLTYEFLFLKMAFDHETSSTSKIYYLIDNYVIEQLNTKYNYPVKTLEDLGNYIKNKQIELYKVMSEIIERLDIE